MRILYLLLSFTLLPICCYGQTFANTKFDLSPDLPVESVSLSEIYTKKPKMVVVSNLQILRTLKPGLSVVPSKSLRIISSPTSSASNFASNVMPQLSGSNPSIMESSAVISSLPAAAAVQDGISSHMNKASNLEKVTMKLQAMSHMSSSAPSPMKVKIPPRVDTTLSTSDDALSVSLEPILAAVNSVTTQKPSNTEKTETPITTAKLLQTTSSSTVLSLNTTTLEPKASHPLNSPHQVHVTSISPPFERKSNSISSLTVVKPKLPVQTTSSTAKLNQRIKLVSTTPWYQEVFDVSGCAKDLRGMAVEFRRKFPTKVLKSGKDVRLAEVILHRLLECQRKEANEHWDEVDQLLEKITTIKSSEISDCRNALVEEHISCMNLISYTCQFVQPTFQFRLLPAKLIIQEARSAERAAEVCRTITAHIKERLEIE